MYLKNQKNAQAKKNKAFRYAKEQKKQQTLSEEQIEKEKITRNQETNARNEKMDESFGFPKYESGPAKIGWLSNFRTTSIVDENEQSLSAIDYYFIGEDGDTFKCTITNEPYFYIGVKPGMEQQAEQYVIKQYSTKIARTMIIEKEDLEMVRAQFCSQLSF